MRVSVHYMTQLKRAAGCTSESIETPEGSTLGELVGCLSDRHGDSFRAMLLDGSDVPHRWLLFFVGEERAELTHFLRAGDAVTILAPMAGG